MKLRLFTHPSIPMKWFAEDFDGELYMFDPKDRGWKERVLPPPHLRREFLKETPAHFGIGTGWPGWPPKTQDQKETA